MPSHRQLLDNLLVKPKRIRIDRDDRESSMITLFSIIAIVLTLSLVIYCC